MRSREFIMKDLYSFNVDENAHQEFYEKAKQAYVRIFDRCGIGGETYVTFAAGGSFSKYSHEFQAVTEAGEDTIYVHEGKKLAVNKEVLNDEVLADLGMQRSGLSEKKAVEVGNIFSLGTKFSDAIGLHFKDHAGDNKPVIMGSYGIGPGRLMGTIAEIWSDEKGLVWPENIAPFAIHLVALYNESGEVKKVADELYKKLTSAKIEVLYDDRDCGAGEKFGDSDLIGIPVRYVVSEKSLKENCVEIKDRKTGKVEMKKVDTI
jgi:prolyl-tRNA synthetase